MNEPIQLHLYRLAVGRTSINGPDGPWTAVTTDDGTPVLETFGETAEESERIARQIVARWNAVEDIHDELTKQQKHTDRAGIKMRTPCVSSLHIAQRAMETK